MTEDRMALVELLQKSGEGDFLRAVAEAVLQILMEADVEGLIGAGRHERSTDRLNYRRYHDASGDVVPCEEGIMDRSESVGTCGAAATVLVAIELSKSAWVLAVHDPVTDKISWRRVDTGNTAGLIATCEKARAAAAGRLLEPVDIECVFEAGYDGFWLQRRLHQAGIACRVMDPASLKVDRRARRVKTDRIDAESLLRALQAWRRGDRQACNFVRVPTVEEEDARRPHRELNRLRKERVGHVNRIKALLALHGISNYQPMRQDRRSNLAELRTAEGQTLPPACRAEIDRELARLELVLQHIAQVEAVLAPSQTANAADAAAMLLEKLTCVGHETAIVLSREVLCREFRDRRSLAAFVGLTPSPYSSGRLQHDQGISKAGNSIVRARLVQLAWRWIRFQNGSDITTWFIQRTVGQSRRSRRVAIVAVARKLLVALWRYATQGLVPAGARLKPIAAS